MKTGKAQVSTETNSPVENLLGALRRMWGVGPKGHQLCGMRFRGGEDVLRVGNLNTGFRRSDVSLMMREALAACGWKAQRGFFGVNANNPDALEYYVQHGKGNDMQYACIELAGNPQERKLLVSFGG